VGQRRVQPTAVPNELLESTYDKHGGLSGCISIYAVDVPMRDLLRKIPSDGNERSQLPVTSSSRPSRYEQPEPRLGICGLRLFGSLRHEPDVREQLGSIDQDLPTAPADVLQIVTGTGVPKLGDDPIHSGVDSDPRNTTNTPWIGDLNPSSTDSSASRVSATSSVTWTRRSAYEPRLEDHSPYQAQRSSYGKGGATHVREALR